MRRKEEIVKRKEKVLSPSIILSLLLLNVLLFTALPIAYAQRIDSYCALTKEYGLAQLSLNTQGSLETETAPPFNVYSSSISIPRLYSSPYSSMSQRCGFSSLMPPFGRISIPQPQLGTLTIYVPQLGGFSFKVPIFGSPLNFNTGGIGGGISISCSSGYDDAGEYSGGSSNELSNETANRVHRIPDKVKDLRTDNELVVTHNILGWESYPEPLPVSIGQETDRIRSNGAGWTGDGHI